MMVCTVYRSESTSLVARDSEANSIEESEGQRRKGIPCKERGQVTSQGERAETDASLPPDTSVVSKALYVMLKSPQTIRLRNKNRIKCLPQHIPVNTLNNVKRDATRDHYRCLFD